MRHGLALVHNKVLQEFKFRRGKVNGLSMSDDFSAFKVNIQSRCELKGGISLALGTLRTAPRIRARSSCVPNGFTM
jgi:hypothetical protein